MKLSPLTFLIHLLILFIYNFRCDNKLKVWPKGLGPNVFKCQIGQECDPEKQQRELAAAAAGGEKGHLPIAPVNLTDTDEINRPWFDAENNGDSRYVCFADGFDCCKKCADYILAAIPPLTASTLNNTASSASNGSSASKQLNGGWFDVQLKTISHQVADKDKNGLANGKVTVVQNEG